MPSSRGNYSKLKVVWIVVLIWLLLGVMGLFLESKDYAPIQQGSSQLIRQKFVAEPDVSIAGWNGQQGSHSPGMAVSEKGLWTYATENRMEFKPVDTDVDVVRTGFFVDNIYAINLDAPLFMSEGRFWLQWKPRLQEKLDALGIRSGNLISQVNRVEAWDGFAQPVGSAPVRLENGDYFQLYKFSGKYNIKNLDLHRYPFVDLHLPIALEFDDPGDWFEFDRLRLQPDRDLSGIGVSLDVLGFNFTNWCIDEFRHVFRTHFDRPKNGGKTQASYSQVVFMASYSKSVWASIWNLFMPVMVVMTIVILSPSLDGELWEVRIAIPATAILTLVFMQAGYKSLIPDLPYMTFIDKIYAISYLICMACFALDVWSANQLQRRDAEQISGVIRRIDRVDKIFQLSSLMVLVVGGILGWYL